MNDIETKEALEDHLTSAGQPSTDPKYKTCKDGAINKALKEVAKGSKNILPSFGVLGG